jgi:hypothetical protein
MDRRALTIIFFLILGIAKALGNFMSAFYVAFLMLLVFAITSSPFIQDTGLLMGYVMNITILSSHFFLDVILHKPIREGWLQAVYLSGVGKANIIVPQFLLLTFSVAVLGYAAAVCSTLLLESQYSHLWRILVAISYSSPIIAVILLVVGMVTAGSNHKVLQYILSLPLMVPVLLCACGSLEHEYYYSIMLGMNMVYIPLFLVLGGATLSIITHN